MIYKEVKKLLAFLVVLISLNSHGQLVHIKNINSDLDNRNYQFEIEKLIDLKINFTSILSVKGVRIDGPNFTFGAVDVQKNKSNYLSKQKSIELTGLSFSNITNSGILKSLNENFLDENKNILRNEYKISSSKNSNKFNNIGPSLSYKLRDGLGKEREYKNYMFPVDTGDGVPVFLLGMREMHSEQFRYLRPPADENSELTGFIRLRAALQNSELRDRAVQIYTSKAVDPNRPNLREQLASSAARTLSLFAGLEAINGQKISGLQALADFLKANVPESNHQKTGEMFVRILNGTLLELDVISRKLEGVKPLPKELTSGFFTQAVLALSDVHFYPSSTIFLPDELKLERVENQ